MVVEAVILPFSAAVGVDILGMQDIIPITFQHIRPWFVDHGLRIIFIIAGTALIRYLVGIFIEKFIQRIIKPDQVVHKEDEKRREDLLIRIADDVFAIFIWVLAGIMILSELGVNIGPLLAGTGVVGIAIGFGAQYLIHDVLAGLAAILENHYRVGDIVRIDNVWGWVEDVTLRITILRDLDGTVHYIPHGEIKQVANLSKQFSRVNLNVRISYKSDLEKVIKTVDLVGLALAEDPDWKEYIIKPPQFLRVDDFADSAIVIKILGDVKPLKHLEVTGELRKRLKIAFDKEGIEIPFPQRVIHQAKG